MNDYDKKILKGLIKSCLLRDPKIFLPYLKNRNVITGMPNKLTFYSFFKYMVECSNCNSENILFYKWKRIRWKNKTNLSLQIFEEFKKFPRLTIIIIKKDNKLFLQTLPF